MRMVTGCAALLAAMAGCLASSEGGAGSQIDEIYDLEQQLDMLECECDVERFMLDDDCALNDDVPAEARSCVADVVNKHRDEFQPLIDCTLRTLRDAQACYDQSGCGSAAWDSCRTDDCDESVADKYENELEDCIRMIQSRTE